MDLKELRDKAGKSFAEQGFPNTKQEAWRFTDLSPLVQAEFKAEWKPCALPFEPLGRIVVVFENGRFSRGRSNLEALPAGVCIGSIMDRVDDRLGTLADVRHAFVAANTAAFEDGAFIEISEGVKLETPIHLVFLADVDGAALHVRNLFSCGRNSSLTVVEEYVGRSDATYWTNAVTEVFVEDGGRVDHYKIQRESVSAFHFQTVEASVGKDAAFGNHAIAIGARLGRNDIRGRLVGEGGKAVCNGLYLLKERQLFDTHMFMDHAVARCSSHELYKGIMDDKARAVFCGRILVRQDAQQTDAIQSNKNLLLSRAAKVNSLPQLEIHADDVKCTHGATVGQLDAQALFYLQTRGIDPVEGRAMLTFAFANEVLDGIECKAARIHIGKLVHAWLDGVSA